MWNIHLNIDKWLQLQYYSPLDEEVKESARDLLRLPGYNSSLYSPTSKNKPEQVI